MINGVNGKTEIRFKKKAKTIGLLALPFMAVVISKVLFGFVFPRMHGLYNFRITITLLIYGLFGFVFCILLKQIFSRKPALIIDDTGITDHSSPESVGHIPWADIIRNRISTWLE